MKKIFVLVCLLTLVCGCTKDKEIDSNISKNEKLEKVISENNYIIVDVRTKEEYDNGHVVGAVNIPYDEITASTNLDKNKTIIVYCRSGNRSGIAYNNLTSMGYTVLDLGAYDSINLEKE